jgi:hypothetical protein
LGHFLFPLTQKINDSLSLMKEYWGWLQESKKTSNGM